MRRKISMAKVNARKVQSSFVSDLGRCRSDSRLGEVGASDMWIMWVELLFRSVFQVYQAMRSWQALAAVLPLQLVWVLLDPFSFPGNPWVRWGRWSSYFCTEVCNSDCLDSNAALLPFVQDAVFFLNSCSEFQECGFSGPVSLECLLFTALLWVFFLCTEPSNSSSRLESFKGSGEHVQCLGPTTGVVHACIANSTSCTCPCWPPCPWILRRT